MPQVEITIGGRSFEVACQEGEEHFLHSAAAMLNEEAEHLSNQIGRMPEARMLLMAGLMLADKTAVLEDKVKESGNEAASLRAQLENTGGPAAAAAVSAPAAAGATEALEEIAAQAEALAQHVEAKVG